MFDDPYFLLLLAILYMYLNWVAIPTLILILIYGIIIVLKEFVCPNKGFDHEKLKNIFKPKLIFLIKANVVFIVLYIFAFLIYILSR